MSDRKKVLICTPRYAVDPPEAADFRIAVAYTLGKWESESTCPYSFNFSTTADVVVQLARDIAAQVAIRDGFDYLAMIDDDMVGPSNDLWARLLAHDVDIVAPLAFMRNPPHYPVCYALRGGWDDHQQMAEYHNDVILNYPKNCLFECDAVGFGAVLIKTEVLKGVGKYPFMSTNPTGEDILFCVKARKKGFRVFCDTTYCLKHLGPRQYIDEAYFESHDPKIESLRTHLGDWTREKAEHNLAS